MDICCGLTMVARLQSVYAEEDAVLIHDVPLLVCPTCHSSFIAPEIELDYLMFAHYCATDGVKAASLSHAIGEEKIFSILERYPEDLRCRKGVRVVSEQIDILLDLLNLAIQTKDAVWQEELKEKLQKMHSLLT
jgi:YgiT-type zinc finger domain-containing protein